MKSRMLNKLIGIFFVLFILSSCTKDLIVQDPPAPPPPPPVPGKISFTGEIQPIFTANCVSCHDVGHTAPVLAAGKSYQALMGTNGMINTSSPGNSILYQMMAPGGAMSSYCTKANADSVYKWIDQGAENN